MSAHWQVRHLLLLHVQHTDGCINALFVLFLHQLALYAVPVRGRMRYAYVAGQSIGID
jgi:hypothetical protein